MKLTYVTAFNHNNIHNWSGLGFYYGRMLREAGFVDVHSMNACERKFPYDSLHWFKVKFNSIVLGKSELPLFNIEAATSFARLIHNNIKNSVHVISPNTATLAYLKDDIKKILYTDSTLENLLNSYPNYRHLGSDLIAEAQEIERLAISNADLLLYTSDWAANSAIQDYGADPQKVFIVPFGANMNKVPDREELTSIVNRRQLNKHINLLFIGVDWARKGGPHAVRVAEALNALGFPTTLHVVGIRHMPKHIANDFIIDHGYISKNSASGERRLHQLMAESSFLVLPTLADCTPVVFSEANAFGIPCLASDVGGTTSVIKPEINGKTFPLSRFVEDVVDYIVEMSSKQSVYNELCFSSFDMYINELNWKTTGRKIFNLISSL